MKIQSLIANENSMINQEPSQLSRLSMISVPKSKISALVQNIENDEIDHKDMDMMGYELSSAIVPMPE